MLRIPFFYLPEYYKNKEYTESSEVYSYGLIISELFTNHTPIQSENLIEHLANIRKNFSSVDTKMQNSHHKLFA